MITVAVAMLAHGGVARGDCFTNPCGSGCPNRCVFAICPETASCDPNCGGNPCGPLCVCWSACSATRCNPLCPGGNACADGCPNECNVGTCPNSICDRDCHSDVDCNPLCGGNLCNPGCNDCNFFLCPEDLCDLNCRPAAACDPLCGGNPCAPNCPTGCGCPSARCFNIEIDYMVDDDHTHRPNQVELDAVIQMFACQGWTLNIQISDAIPHYDLIPADPITCLDIFHYIGEDASFGRLKQQYADHAFEPGWHYAIFAHDYQLKVRGQCVNTGSSGLAEAPGHDLIVTLGQFGGGNQIGTAFDRAATLAHEFGHNLGLSHCGDMDDGGLFGGDCANVGSFPPNLGSIMSYVYQLSGVRSGMLCNNFSFDEAVLFKEMDYSHGTMCDLNESALDEVFGTGMLGVDWDCSGSISGTVNHDLDQPPGGGSWCPSTGGRQTLSDFDEWGFIEAEHAVTATAGPRPSRQPTPCITADEVRQYVIAGGCTAPTLSTEACENRDMIYLHPAGGAGADGTCSVPYQNVQTAHDVATNGSVMFFRAGSYPQPGRVLLTKPMKLFNQPTAGQSTTVITAP